MRHEEEIVKAHISDLEHIDADELERELEEKKS